MTTVVLVHGAWHDSECWSPVRARLDAVGVAHAAVDLPFTGHLDDVHAVVDLLDSIDGPKVLVGHSYGGLVISGAAQGRDDIVHLVYLCAFLLEKGASIFDGLGDFPPTRIFDALTTTDDGRSAIDPDHAVETFYAASPPDRAQALVEHLRPMDPTSTGHQALGDPWRSVPTTYVICDRDQAIHPDAQRRMAEAAGEVVTLDTDHSPFLSATDRTAAILVERARR